jgi:hypothetical protein
MARKSGERKAVSLPSGGVNVWDLLTDALRGAGERPENSVTPAELAAKSGFSHSHAAAVLARNEALTPVWFRNEGKRRGVCYVPKEAA